MITAYAAAGPGQPFEPMQYDPGPLGSDGVEIRIESCGICHSDLSMLNNEWDMTVYPFVGGHEIVGIVEAVGEHVPERKVKVGDRVGLGWYSESCMHCQSCLHGDHNLCLNDPGQTIVSRHGGFADRVRCHWGWAIKIPQGIDASKAGPLFCGGITVFNPIVQNNISPLSRTAVIGIGGLGHLALMFLRAWGCEVTAFSTRPDKEAEARSLGAHEFVHTREPDALDKLAGKFDLILNTAAADLDWDALVNTLAPKGRLHTVGVVPGDFGVKQVFPMLVGQKAFSGSPLGSPATTADMLEFCARHDLDPITEEFAMADINDAFEKLHNGSPRYRLVLRP